MIIQCNKCKMYYDDQFRLTICPHNTFSANDGWNYFRHYPESWYHVQPPLEFVKGEGWDKLFTDDYKIDTKLRIRLPNNYNIKDENENS